MRSTACGRAWPSSALAAADVAFTQLTCDPDPTLTLDCARLPGTDGLPGEVMNLRDLRTWMLRHRGAYGARDAVWRELVVRARRDGPAWVIGAVGMAMPALVRFAGSLSRGYRGQAADLDAEILTGFLAALRDGVDPQAGRVYARLCWAGFRAGIALRHRDAAEVLVIDPDSLGGGAPQLPYGHPDLIVARAVDTGLIEAADADLIVATRLEGRPLQRVAAVLGADVAVLRMRRMRAERALVAGIADGTLSGLLSTGVRDELAARAARRTLRPTAG